MKNVTTVIAVLLLSLCCASSFAQTSGQQGNNSSSAASTVKNVERVNINSAGVDALASNLHQVGIKKAEAIVAWRDENGKFTTVEQLMEVKGIGESTLEANRERIDL